MLAHVMSGAIAGVDGYIVHVEVDIANGLPSMTVVGLPESSVREGRERVTAALSNAGLPVPPRRITINLAPADVRKVGSAFDLPLAVGILAASGSIGIDRLHGVCMVGELGLDGELRPVRGVLPLAVCCERNGVRTLVVPAGNGREAAIVDGIEVLSARSLGEIIEWLRGSGQLERAASDTPTADTDQGRDQPDFADVKGQGHARRALEIAAAGQHNVLLIGPPGSGKSMLARRLPGILPPMTRIEAIAVTKIYSVAGRLKPGDGLVRERPFRAPHHTISDAGLVGGGSLPRPGEVSLAHNGVLFVDELPEFRRHVLESLRQPVEDGWVHLGRSRQSVTYPGRVMLVAAMNPCPCGYHGGERAQCICHAGAVRRYRARVSGPLLDRIDLHVHVPPLSERQLTDDCVAESSESIRARVRSARERQLERFRGTPIHANAQMGPDLIRSECRINGTGRSLLHGAIRRLGLSARAYHRVLRLARTIADLDGSAGLQTGHLAEAIQYRTWDRTLANEV